MEFMLNGKKVVYEGDPEEKLLDVLRNEYRLVSAKDGCSGQAFCGACTVEMDGKGILACSTPMRKTEGKSVVTVEGLGEETAGLLSFAFAQAGAVQCGFCTPGYLMRTKILLDNNPGPSVEEIKEAFRSHFCRCTGFVKIIKAVQIASELMKTGKFPASDGNIKADAVERALGRTAFVDDLLFDGMLFGALKFSDHPRAEIIRIDKEYAETLPGVKKILTAADIPGERTTGLIVKDWPMMIAEGEITAYTGDVLALAIADSGKTARAAADAVKVEYKVLEALTDYETAPESSIKVHPGGNLLEKSSFRKGEDADSIIAESAYSVNGTYRTQRIEHAFLETEAALALPQNDGSVMLYANSQGIYEDRSQLSEILNLPKEKIRVVLCQSGGGFGGKEDLTVQHHACLAALNCGKPVKVRLNREESFRMHPKRHPMTLKYTLACDSKGIFTALKAEIIGDTGAYASVGGKVLERAAGHAASAYYVPNTDVTARAVYTNNVPCGAMRGFGVNQAAFAMESSIDELCRAGGFDRWEIRYNNALKDGLSTVTGQVLSGGVGVTACLEKIKPFYDKARYKGLACGIKNTGIGNGIDDIGIVRIIINDKAEAEVYHGWTEMGQGIFTVARQFVNKCTGIPVDRVNVYADTSMEAPAGMTTASRGTSLLGNAIIKACEKLKADLDETGLENLKGNEYRGEWKCSWTTRPGETGKDGRIYTHYSYGYAAQLAVLDNEGNVQKIIAAHDAGRIINPLLFGGQIEGAVHMGLGYALSEDFPCRDGIPEYSRMRQLGMIGIRDMPQVEVIGVEVPDPYGPLGAKGVGEIGLVPTAAAVANAFAEYDGERIFSLPLLKNRKKRGGSG